MKLIEIISQHYNDFTGILECEHCGSKKKITNGYDDDNYHNNVIPSIHCPDCGMNRAGNIKHEQLTFNESRQMFNYQKSMKDKVQQIAEDYNLLEKITEFEDETDYSRILKVLEQCMWVGYCNGKEANEAI